MVEMRANLQPRISTAQTPMPRPPSLATAVLWLANHPTNSNPCW